MTNEGAEMLATEDVAAKDGEKIQSWSNTRLVQECINGREDAWCALVDRYKNLIFSVPIKYGFSREEAADVFQMVCLELLSSLPQVRDPRALPKWILMATSHKCYHLRNQDRRHHEKASAFGQLLEEALPPEAEVIVRQAENEQNVRQAIAGLPARCRELIRMLFFEDPARPYRQIAEMLGLATGSIGFIRQRCLGRLRRRLDQIGYHRGSVPSHTT
jgi:RNA polymerase sigma factor (sigma-70 family)